MKDTTASPSPQAQAMLKALQDAVTNSLEKKRKLGQYAVVWKDGQAQIIHAEAATDRTTKAK